MIDVFRKRFADDTAQAIKKTWPKYMSDIYTELGINPEEFDKWVYDQYEVTRKPKHGDYSFPCFKLTQVVGSVETKQLNKGVNNLLQEGFKSLVQKAGKTWTIKEYIGFCNEVHKVLLTTKGN